MTPFENAPRRFQNRVEDYVRYRPGYPPQLVPFLVQSVGLSSAWRIADIGSGTGLSAEPFLTFGNEVIGVEPNRSMAAAAMLYLQDFPRFQCVHGAAEDTGLPKDAVDMIIAGQAFHWFSVESARTEFRRILRDDGWCVLMWNDRRVGGTEFLRSYELFLHEWGTDYDQVRARYADARAMQRLFGHDEFQAKEFPSRQDFDFSGLRGRLLSSSYTPSRDDPKREAMLDALRQLFERCEVGGSVRFEYDTKLYYGKLRSIQSAEDIP